MKQPSKNMFSIFFRNVRDIEDGQNDQVNWQYLAGTNSANGCLAEGSLLNNFTPVPTLPAPQLLYRFGVLLAVNAVAHRYWPDLPVADSYEQGIAKQLGASR
jgi:hypothetical protein